jgi:hypothetical protein
MTPESAAERARGDEGAESSPECSVEEPPSAGLVGVDVLASTLSHDGHSRHTHHDEYERDKSASVTGVHGRGLPLSHAL